ncbi:subtilase [Camillea tinctor]|nr:subtilase [Camillea tinctor]
MKFLPTLFRAAPAHDRDTIYDLLIAVLPAFTALATRQKELERSGSDKTLYNFYLNFEAKSYILNDVLSHWELIERAQKLPADNEELRSNLLRVLDELESCFLSRKKVSKAYNELKFKIERENYPKLCALRRILPEDDHCEEFASTLTNIIRIDSKRPDKRENLLYILDQAFAFICSLGPIGPESDPACQIRFWDYPLKHLWEINKTLFNVIQKSWFCQCTTNKAHVDRKARLNLTHHQRFQTTRTKEQDISNSGTLLRILFPTNSPSKTEWQDIEIAVKDKGHERDRHEKADRGLCMIMQEVIKGTRPRMVILGKILHQLKADLDINTCPQVLDNKFKSLKDLLQLNGRKSLLSSIEQKHGLVLSFILATSLIHLVEGPWLQGGLNSENICFLVSDSESFPDITKPYLITSCASPMQKESIPGLNQPHRFPQILSLGIILLEIARGVSIYFNESQDRCFIALKCMDDWNKTSQTNLSRPVPDGLRKAISACIDPREFRENGLDKTSVNSLEVRKYIFEKVLHPLGQALSTTYEIQLNTLHEYIAQVKGTSWVGSFDQQDIQQEGQKRAKEWHKYLDGVHDLFYECQDRCKSIASASREAARVKVAVLHTGLQLPTALQENYEKERRINVQQSENFVDPTNGAATHEWRVDNSGHGSCVGQIILKFAPAADLHVAKVFNTKGDLADPKIATQAHKRIAKAIKRATEEWNVDMIIMSFGFDEPIRLIPTRNDGAHKSMAWPARDRSVIGISSTDGDGVASSFNPSDKDVDAILYAFGEDVPITLAHPSNPGKYVTKFVTGTSYATPVAAALAANLLGCVRMMVSSSSPEDQHIYNHIPEELQQLDGMLAVLRCRMRKKHNCGTESLLPWEFLKTESLYDNKILKDIAETLREG